MSVRDRTRERGGSQPCRSAGPFRVDPDDVDHLFEFVGDFQPPVLSRRERGVEIAKYLSRRSGRFAKGGPHVWKFLAFGIDV